MAVTNLNLTYVDHSKEKTTVTIALAPIAADGSNWDTLVSDVASETALLKAAIDAITTLNHVSTGISVPKYAETLPLSYPAYGADRELAVRFVWQDDVTGFLGHFDIPSPVDIFNTDSDEVDMSDALVIALKALIDADAYNPRTGNTVTLIRGYKVGRNN